MNWRRAFLVMKNVAWSKWSYGLNSGTVALGSDPACPIWLPNVFGGVAARHAETGLDKAGRWLWDLGTVAGTAINGVWIDGRSRASLKIADLIWIGGLEIVVVSQVPEPARVQPAEWPSLLKEQAVGQASSLPNSFSRHRQAGSLPHGDENKPLDWSQPYRERFRKLTDTELEITLEFSRGNIHANKIAECFGFGPGTAKVHLRAIYAKLGVHSEGDLQMLLTKSTQESSIAGGGGINEELCESIVMLMQSVPAG